ncbi:DUF6009 family protein [Streptomyces sp. NBC_00019]|uniref:DUF6009 family protein n=1 Tax=Streptomyces sp. NBC_00019 TaxID=2975623 RepID=UPI003866C68C
MPDWLIEQSIGHHAPPVYVHVGGCHMAGKRSKGVPREEAIRALAEGVDPCLHCRPDCGFYKRRVFFLLSHDRDTLPNGLYREGASGEAVDPRTIEPKSPTPKTLAPNAAQPP